MLREAWSSLPPGTAKVAVTVELRGVTCCTNLAAADGIFLRVENGSGIPGPLPLNVNLMQNGSFENGWSSGSPINPNQLQIWEGESGEAVFVAAYSDVVVKSPDTIVSCLIGGGIPGFSCVAGGAGNLLFHTGTGVLRQRIDARGR